MQVPSLLQDLLVLFLLASSVLWLFHRLHLPSITGFLVTGLIVGPFGLRWVRETEAVHVLAEIGVVLLLFTIGAEFSLRKLVALRRHVLGGGILQVGLTILFIWLLSRFFLPIKPAEGFVLGCMVSLSSTAVVMRLLASRGETAGPSGRAILGMLIFQDLCVVPMMLAVSVLGGSHIDPWRAIVLSLLVFVGLLAAARVLIPRLLEQAAKTRSHELFVFVVGLIVLGTAWISAEAGLSLALGAFVAGMVVADNEYSHQVLTEVLPFRESFIGLFFTSVGMLVNPSIFITRLPEVVAWGSAVIAGKIAVILLVSLILRYSWPVALRTSFTLGQIGEFSFVLAGAALGEKILAPDRYQLMVAVTVVSMMLSPVLLSLGNFYAERTATWKLPVWLFGSQSKDSLTHASQPLSRHVIIVGFGLNGRRLATSLQNVGMPAIALEIDPSRLARENSPIPVLFGDATSSEVLDAAGMERAIALVVAVSDFNSTRRILQAARQLAPEVPVIARTRHLRDVAELYELGGKEIVVEEVEANLEILLLLLGLAGLDNHAIRKALEPYLHHPLRHPFRPPRKLLTEQEEKMRIQEERGEEERTEGKQ
jgi:CPA2 family monovalent cation:H+ antiporter-2